LRNTCTKERKDLWGYAPNESFTIKELIDELYDGIRPAPGYPACPDHTVKADMFKLLQAEEIGMQLTDSFAMLPAAAVSGFYFAHKDAKYFSVDKIGIDQLEDMAKRRNLSKDYLERWLAPNLG
jgi:5-methyltetrahydrofolate--homocysteine methyltransferase